MYDVIIVGLGLTGASAAYHLLNTSTMKLLCLE